MHTDDSEFPTDTVSFTRWKTEDCLRSFSEFTALSSWPENAWTKVWHLQSWREEFLRCYRLSRGQNTHRSACITHNSQQWASRAWGPEQHNSTTACHRGKHTLWYVPSNKAAGDELWVFYDSVSHIRCIFLQRWLAWPAHLLSVRSLQVALAVYLCEANFRVLRYEDQSFIIRPLVCFPQNKRRCPALQECVSIRASPSWHNFDFFLCTTSLYRNNLEKLVSVVGKHWLKTPRGLH